MARVLIVGCGCRGGALARTLVERGHAVRGTSRDADRLPEIAASGAEAVLADPLRLATLMAPIAGVSAVCWLLGGAHGDPEEVSALHTTRLESLTELLVDTHARGFVYERGGEAGADGAAIAARAARTYRMPIEVIDAAERSHERWLASAVAAVERVLS